MKNRLLSVLLCLCILISLIPAIPGFAASCEHSYTAVVTPPSCASRGYTTYTCSRCGNTYIADEVETLPHHFVNGVCTECGQKLLNINFECDEGVSVSVYETQDFSGAHEDNAKTASPRDSESGKIDCFGEGQVNFVIKLEPGYELESVSAETASAYKYFKLPIETGVVNGYRLTRISGDLTVTVKVRKNASADFFTVNFDCDPGVSVTTYEKQTRTGAYEENATRAIARHGSTGEVDVSGKGQVNFQVVVAPDYRFEGITLYPVTTFKDVLFPNTLGIENGFRINGITGDVTVKVSAVPIGEQECRHDYVSKVIPPTCTEPGYTLYTCAKCADSYTGEQTEPTGHSFSDRGFCTRCGMLAHRIQFVCDPGLSISVSRSEVKGCQIDENVNVAYPRAADSGLIVMDGSGQVHFTVNVEMGYRLESVTPEPAEGVKGFEKLFGNSYRMSGISGDVTVTVRSSVIDPDSCSHEYEALVTPPTCTAGGYTTYLCPICGDSYVGDITAKIAHSYVGGVCAVCGEKRINVTLVCGQGASVTVYETRKTDALCADKATAVHPRNGETGLEDGSGDGEVNFEVRLAEGYRLDSVSAAPASAYQSLKGPADTGRKNGYRITRVKGDCTITVRAVRTGCDHDYIAAYTAPTCTEKGCTVYTCTKCGDSYADGEIPALGHDYTAVVTAPTCTAKGYTTYICARCGDSRRAEEKAALGHDYRAAVTPPTCTEKGYTTYTCARCGYQYVGSETAATGHEFTSAVTVPTCTEKGFTTHTCSKCGCSYTDGEIAAMGHDYRAVVIAPTCTEKGCTTYTCAVCGDRYVDGDTAALGHDYRAAVTAPTCTETGYTTYTCVHCGDTYTGNETAALEHDYKVVVTAPTCTEKGFTVFTCTRCGDRYVGNETAALDHDYRAVVTPPTCTEKGFTIYTCTRCGDEYVGNETPALGHDDRTEVTAPTCTEAGFTTHTCARCGRSYRAEETAASGHDWDQGAVTKQPTETVRGERTYTCVRCGEKRIEAIQPLSHVHQYVAVVVPPTCTEEGCTVHTCRCGDSYTDARVPALGHQSSAVIKAPTCTAKGFTVYTCSRCGEVYTGDETEALGHDYRIDVTAPTCTEKGHTTYTCTRCGSVSTGNETAALGHDYQSAVTEPTCTDRGYTTYTCPRCGDKYTGNETAALGHDYRIDVTAPTCTEQGYSTYTCLRCGEKHTGDETAALGHEYEASETAPTCTEAGFTTHTCTRCGDSYTSDETDALGHDWDEGTVTLQPTQTVPGERTHTCRRCGEKRTAFIPELGHVHVYTAVVTAPTCTEGGCTTHVCACGDSYVSDETDALGHDYFTAVTAPTCTETGFTTYTCLRCGESHVGDEAAALGHDYETAVTAPTCTDTGFTTYTCRRCGESHAGEEAAALGHDYETTVAAPTCTEAGFTTYTCARCGDSYVGDETGALGHDWDKGTVTVEPSQTVPGQRTYTCRRCGEQRIESIPELSHVHAYAAVVTAPTCTEGGYTTHVCTCGDSYVDSEVAPLGHSFGNWTATAEATCTGKGAETRVCARCGAAETRETEPLGHDLTDHKAKAPTCTEAGWNAYQICARCGYTTWSELSALGHSYVDGVCVRCGKLNQNDLPPVSYEALNMTIAKARKIDQSRYTGESCAVLEDALRAAEAAGSADRQTEVDAAREALEAAVGALKEKDTSKAASFRFDDVKDENQYFYEPVYWAVDREITNGASPTTFNPGAGCTRAQVVTFLWRAAGKPEPMRTTNPFEDVQDDQYYTKAILWAVEQEITNGTGDGLFNPSATCTRGQIVTFLWRYFDKPEIVSESNPFTDVFEGQYYTQAVLWAVDQVITKGTGPDTFSPNATCTRGQIVTFLSRAMAEEEP